MNNNFFSQPKNRDAETSLLQHAHSGRTQARTHAPTVINYQAVSETIVTETFLKAVGYLVAI